MDLKEMQKLLEKISQEQTKNGSLSEERVQELFKIVENLESTLEKETPQLLEIDTIEEETEE